MKIKPPASDIFSVLQAHAQLLNKELSADYLRWERPLDDKGRYLPYAEFRYRVGSGLDAEIAWRFIRSSRRKMSRPVIELGEPATACSLFLTPCMQQTISHTDQNTTEPVLHWINSQIGEQRNLEFLFNDLIEDESISSSQLEGAATTTQAAKEMLKTRRKPRTPDERMIIGNYRMMAFAWEKRHQPLDCDLIQELHYCGVQGIDDEKYQPGHLRTSNDVVVADKFGEVVHQPPDHQALGQRLRQLCDWVNSEGDTNNQYLHPLLKAIILHFSIGFEHPFRDGNGRVARALFYWYLFKQGYPAFRYISISHLLKKAPVQYGTSYLYTETDEMDLTYFVDYQCQIVQRAITRFVDTYKTAIKGIQEFNQFLYSSNLYGQLSDRERTVFQVAHSGVASSFTINNVAENLGCAYNTAATTLNNLVKNGLFGKRKQGREWVYQMIARDEIMRNWKQI